MVAYLLSLSKVFVVWEPLQQVKRVLVQDLTLRLVL
jgi:hypothetical protein